MDKALAGVAPPGLSRSRLTDLIRTGHVADETGAPVTDPKRKTKPGDVFAVTPPPPAPAAPAAQAIALDVVFEDAHLIVVDKPAGMVVHPAPGSPDGTLVNALLHHCGESLSGVGGEIRPGVVHRIDKDTSGLLVAAKTDAAHQGLSALFAAHDLDREYLAVTRGAPDRANPRLMGTPGLSMDPPWFRLETMIGRHPGDRKKMAVARGGAGRRAVTRFRVEERLGAKAALVRCRLETGRTHQIRVHMAHLGHGLIGDPVYGKGGGPGFSRQALHAARLGFTHPVTSQPMDFVSELPPDMAKLTVSLKEM